MLISEMIGMLAQVLADFGDKEVTLVNEETGEVRYAIGISVQPESSSIEIEHLSYGEYEMVQQLNAFEEMFGC